LSFNPANMIMIYKLQWFELKKKDPNDPYPNAYPKSKILAEKEA
jgi:hypothetical protein